MNTISNLANEQTVNKNANFECYSPFFLGDVITQAASTNSSKFIESTNDWLVQMCGRGSCNSQVIQTVAANVSAGCGSNIGDIALSSPASVLATVQLGYPIIRNMMCLQDTNFNFCMSKNWTTAALQLTMVNDPVAVIEQLISKSFNTDCNECTKAAFQLYNKAFPQINGTGLITDVCGADFAATLNNPVVNIRQSAQNGTYSSGAGILAAPAMGTLFLTAMLIVTSL
jgi:hypothetical protein